MLRRQLPKPWVRATIGIAISAGFVAATISDVEADLLAHAWARVGIGYLALATLVSLAELCIRAVRWRLLLRPIADVQFRVALGYLSIGHLANAILPARLGDIARALFAGVRMRVSRSSVLGTIAIERLADAGLLGTAMTLGVVIGFGDLAPTVVVLAIAGAVAVITALLLLVVLRRQSVAATRVGGLLRHHGEKFVAGASALRRPLIALTVGLLTVSSFALAVTILTIVGTAVGLSLPIWQAALIIAAVTLSTAIPAGPASIGTYEFAGMTVMTSMGFPPEQSLLCVALVHAVAVLPPSLLGLLAMWWLGVHPHAPRVAAGSNAATSERPA